MESFISYANFNEHHIMFRLQTFILIYLCFFLWFQVMGMERLKTELQSRGLKCGGTLSERAARLFLLKSTPIDKLPKKLLAKK